MRMAEWLDDLPCSVFEASRLTASPHCMFPEQGLLLNPQANGMGVASGKLGTCFCSSLSSNLCGSSIFSFNDMGEHLELYVAVTTLRTGSARPPMGPVSSENSRCRVDWFSTSANQASESTFSPSFGHVVACTYYIDGNWLVRSDAKPRSELG